MWELLWKVCEPFVWRLTRPLVLEVDSFHFQDLSGGAGDRLVFITGHPRRYHAELTITNRSGRTVFPKSIALAGHCGRVCKKAEPDETLRFEPHERKKHSATFPVDGDEKPITGQLRIEVTPSVGKKSSESVNLPS